MWSMEKGEGGKRRKRKEGHTFSLEVNGGRSLIDLVHNWTLDSTTINKGSVYIETEHTVAFVYELIFTALLPLLYFSPSSHGSSECDIIKHHSDKYHGDLGGTHHAKRNSWTLQCTYPSSSVYEVPIHIYNTSFQNLIL